MTRRLIHALKLLALAATTTAVSLQTDSDTTVETVGNGLQTSQVLNSDSEHHSFMTLLPESSGPGSGSGTSETGGTSKSASRATTISTMAIPTFSAESDVSESSDDKNVLKIIFSKDNDSDYYSSDFQIGNDSMRLRLDLMQPDLWAMNGNDIFNCTYFSEQLSQEQSSLSANHQTETETTGIATMTICARGGEYFTTSGQAFPTPDVQGIFNGERYDLPYIGAINANGVLLTDEVSFLSSQDFMVSLPNFTFVDVNVTDVFYGGVGLAGNPTGTGFLESLAQNGLINSAGYSLWFFNDSSPDQAVGELLLGAVDTKYVAGDLVSFDMIPHLGPKFSGSRSDLINRLKLPIVPLVDMLVENSNTGQRLSLFDSNPDVPVAFDTRSTYSFVPLSVIINLAIQTNALYNADVDRWIVQCDVIRSANAFLIFTIGSLPVRLSLNDFLVDAVADSQQLKFSDGSKACFLTFLPDTSQGFSSLGLNFLTGIYLAVDNAGGTIAVSNVNRNVSVALSDFSSSSPTSVAASDYAANFTKSISASSIADISAGTIPFATKFSSTQNYTLTYSQSLASGSDAESIPARFSRVTILSGEILITQTFSGSIDNLPGIASAASTSSATKAASRAGYSNYDGNRRVEFFGLIWTGTSVLVGLLFIVVLM